MLAACFDSCFEKSFIRTRGERGHLPSAYSDGTDANRIDGVLQAEFSADFQGKVVRRYYSLTPVQKFAFGAQNFDYRVTRESGRWNKTNGKGIEINGSGPGRWRRKHKRQASSH